MSLFPRAIYTSSDPSFTPLFRLLDDFDSYNREVSGHAHGRHGGRHGHVRLVTPRFDIRETGDVYELHGEVPGIDKKDVTIEFTEPQTIVIRGRVERSHTSGTPSEGAEEEKPAHQATVEDEADEQQTGGEVAKKAENKEVAKSQGNGVRYWVSERSFGEFSRTFTFPSPVDTEGVSASLNNGVLGVKVPKAKKHEARRIAIE